MPHVLAIDVSDAASAEIDRMCRLTGLNVNQLIIQGLTMLRDIIDATEDGNDVVIVNESMMRDAHFAEHGVIKELFFTKQIEEKGRRDQFRKQDFTR